MFKCMGLYCNDWETEYGEPQVWIYLKDNRMIEITHEENGLAIDDQYYSARLHCSDEEFETDMYHSTMGILDNACGSLGTVLDFVLKYVIEVGILI